VDQAIIVHKERLHHCHVHLALTVHPMEIAMLVNVYLALQVNTAKVVD
jgi:hypothetical protein